MVDWPIAQEILQADPRVCQGVQRAVWTLFLSKRPARTLKYRRERNGTKGES